MKTKKQQIYIDNQVFPLGTDLSVKDDRVELDAEVEGEMVYQTDRSPSRFTRVQREYLAVPLDLLLKPLVNLKDELGYETDFIAISTNLRNEQIYNIIPSDLSINPKTDLRCNLTSNNLIGTSQTGIEETVVKTLHLNGITCSDNIGVNYIGPKANEELNNKTRNDIHGDRNVTLMYIREKNIDIREYEEIENLLKGIKYGDLEKVLEIFINKQNKLLEDNCEDDYYEPTIFNINEVGMGTDEDILNTYKSNPDKFIENINRYIGTEWLDLFPRLGNDFKNFINQYFQREKPIMREKYASANFYRLDSPGYEYRSDINLLLKLDKLEHTEVKELITQEIDKELDRIKETLSDFRSRKTKLEKKMKKIPYTEVNITFIGSNDIIKLANKVSKKMEFVNYNSLGGILTKELVSADRFEYFIDHSCRIVVRLEGKFYKYVPTEKDLTSFPDFDSIINQLETLKSKVEADLSATEQRLLFERILSKELVEVDNLGIAVIKDNRYDELIEKLYKIRCGISYLKRVPEELREQYSKMHWLMYCNFFNGENTYGYVDQELLE